jgi:hypothetical protein
MEFVFDQTHPLSNHHNRKERKEMYLHALKLIAHAEIGPPVREKIKGVLQEGHESDE